MNDKPRQHWINYRKLKMNIKKLHAKAIIPKYSTAGAVAFDLHALEDTTIYPGLRLMVHTGISVAVPEGYEMQVRQRSGLSLQFPGYIAIGVGTIDQDYRGELMVPIQNNTTFPFAVYAKDRIAQAIVSPIVKIEFVEVDELDETKRGAGGFGHTG